MTVIGRGRGGRTPYIPNNTGMMKRANRQVEAHAQSQARKFNNALQVDAPKIVCWDNQGGGIPCSCSYAKPPSPKSKITPGEIQDDGFDAVGQSPAGVKSSYRRAGQSDLRSLDPLDGYTPKRKISDWQDRISTGDDDENSITAALQRVSIETSDSADVDDDDPFGILSKKAISCSICMGTGFIDSWHPTAGRRFVLDTSNAYFFTTVGGTVDITTDPNTINLHKDNTAIWLLKFPLVWDYINRIAVYRNDEYIPSDRYTLTWVTVDNSLSGDFTEVGLAALQNADQEIRVIIRALEEITFTHCEVIIFFTQPVRGQLPEVEQLYEDEYVDWAQTITVELPVGLAVKEGSYLSESKYKRVWKVNSVNHRRTAGDNEFGISAELRALHSFERRFYQLEVFKGPISDRIEKLKNF